MSIIDQAIERAKQFEGFEPAPYVCPAGKLTIGYGTNLQRREMPAGVLAVLAPILVASINTGCAVGRNWTGLVVTQGTAKAMLRADMQSAEMGIVQNEKGNGDYSDRFRNSPDAAKLVLLDMAYNMGVPALLKFKRMLAALDRGNWSQAAAELLDSKYAEQVGPRAQANADLLRALTVEDMTLSQRVRWLEEKRATLDVMLQDRGVWK